MLCSWQLSGQKLLCARLHVLSENQSNGMSSHLLCKVYCYCLQTNTASLNYLALSSNTKATLQRYMEWPQSFFLALNRQTHVRVPALAQVILPDKQSSYKPTESRHVLTCTIQASWVMWTFFVLMTLLMKNGVCLLPSLVWKGVMFRPGLRRCRSNGAGACAHVT
jgi:hypothetical protein